MVEVKAKIFVKNLQSPVVILNHSPDMVHSCYGWKWHFSAKKKNMKQKNIHNSAKTYDILLK